jgi:hypothetical protein
VESVALWAMAEVRFVALLEHLGLSGPQRALIVGAIIGRMAAPGSERATHRWLSARSALGELLQVDPCGDGKANSNAPLTQGCNPVIRKVLRVRDRYLPRARSGGQTIRRGGGPTAAPAAWPGVPHQRHGATMVKVNRRLWFPLVWPLLAISAGGTLADQVCKYDSIPATASASRFTDHGDGTVTDQATRLQWKRCSEGQDWSGGTCSGTAAGYTWQQALQQADTPSFAGKDDWRLPDIAELTSIVEEACQVPAIDLGLFPATPGSVYWSSSPDASYTDSAWVLYFYYGGSGHGNKLNAYRVRLVRGGQ